MLAFIHIHKTAGTTVEWILRSSYGAHHCEPRSLSPAPNTAPWQTPLSADDLRSLMNIYPSLQSISGHRIQPHTDIDRVVADLRYFTLLRDPLKMRASMYQHGVMALGADNIRFEDWLFEEQSQNRQTKMIAGQADLSKALELIHGKKILVGVTERFDESMLLIQRLLAPSLNIHYRRMRVASNNQVARELLDSPRTRVMLAEGNEADIELYRTVMEDIYPKQCLRYGPGLADDLIAYRRKLAEYDGHRVSARLMQGGGLSKLVLLADPAPFNRRRLASYLLKHQITQFGDWSNFVDKMV